MTTAEAMYERWINELWAGKPVAAELVSADFVGHWPNREVNGHPPRESGVTSFS